MLKLRNKFKKFSKDGRGYSTAEFALVATTFLTGFFWVFETGLIMTKQMSSLDMTVRDLRLYAKDYKCVDREEKNLNPLGAFKTNQRSEIMYVRACIRVDIMMPNGIALFPGVDDAGVPLVADTAFMNEPE